MPPRKPDQLLPDRVKKALPNEPADMWVYSAFEKDGWVARKAGGYTRAEHPGAAVRVDGRLYEIFTAEPATDPGYLVRYGLKTWDESHTIRSVIPYTPEARAQAAAEHLGETHRQTLRQRIVWLFPFAGLAPDPLQERWEAETALPMAVAAAASCLLEIGIFAALVHTFGRFPSSRALIWFTDYFGVDGFLRLLLVVLFGKPRGLFLFSGPYLLWETVARPQKRAARKKITKLLDEPDEIIRHPQTNHLAVRSILFDGALTGPAPIRFEGAFYRPLAWSLQDRGIKRRWVYEFEKIEREAPKIFRDHTRPRSPERERIARDSTRRYNRAHALRFAWGLYSASQQARLETQYRFPALQMTRATAGLLLAGALLEGWAGWMLAWPAWAYLPCAYFAFESFYRLARSSAHREPTGSVAGVLLRPFLHSLEP
jgi:hypothetical protein